MDIANATTTQLLAGGITVAGGVVAMLWRKLEESRKELAECRAKYEEHLKQSAKDYERFAQELARRRSPNSDPPSS